MSPDLILAVAALVVGPIAGAAASYGGVRVAVRGLEERVKRLEDNWDRAAVPQLSSSRGRA